jgi:hypothetical protein
MTSKHSRQEFATGICERGKYQKKKSVLSDERSKKHATILLAPRASMHESKRSKGAAKT